MPGYPDVVSSVDPKEPPPMSTIVRDQAYALEEQRQRSLDDVTRRIKVLEDERLRLIQIGESALAAFSAPRAAAGASSGY